MTAPPLTPARYAVGDVLPHRQHNRRASEASLRFWSRSIGEMNPRYVDPAYISPVLGSAFVAHPCWLSSVHNGVEYIGPKGTYPVLGSIAWTFERPIVTGERIGTVAWLIGERLTETSLAGPTMTNDIQVEFRDERGGLIASSISRLFHIDPDRARPIGRYASWGRSRYTDEQFAQIEHDYDHESVVNAPRYADDVKIGERLPRIVRGPLTSEEIVLFVGGTSPVPSGEAFAALYESGAITGFVHPDSGLLESTAASLIDDVSAVMLGFPAAHDMGPDRVAQCGSMIGDWMGDLGVLRQLDVRLCRPHMLGDTAWFDGVVTAVSETGPRGASVTIELRAWNQRDETIATGSALVELMPRRASSVAPSVRP